jgi:hypothetical protein
MKMFYEIDIVGSDALHSTGFHMTYKWQEIDIVDNGAQHSSGFLLTYK